VDAVPVGVLRLRKHCSSVRSQTPDRRALSDQGAPYRSLLPTMPHRDPCPKHRNPVGPSGKSSALKKGNERDDRQKHRNNDNPQTAVLARSLSILKDMWKRHTEAARAAHWRADRWARHNGWREIPVDLYLYVLFADEECRASRLLCLAGVNPDAIKTLASFPPQGEPVSDDEKISIAPQLEEMIRRSYDIAVKELGSPKIGTEHILLALVERKLWAESSLLSGIDFRSYLNSI